jgi:hypothetical protein
MRTDDFPCLLLRAFLPVDPHLTEQDVERGFMHVGIPRGGKHMLQDAPTVHQLKLPAKRRRGVDADPDQTQYLVGHERRGLLAQEEETDTRQRKEGGELGEQRGLRQ